MIIHSKQITMLNIIHVLDPMSKVLQKIFPKFRCLLMIEYKQNGLLGILMMRKRHLEIILNHTMVIDY